MEQKKNKFLSNEYVNEKLRYLLSGKLTNIRPGVLGSGTDNSPV